MLDVEKQKSKLMQKKNKLLIEENKLKVKEYKMRTKRLIEIGGLVVRVGLDHLPTNTIYGALLSLKHSLEKNNIEIRDQWAKLGQKKLDQEQKQKTAIIIKFIDEPTAEIRSKIRNLSLKWNSLRQEWYGYVSDLDTLKAIISNLKHELQIIS